ncbi:ankyrin [Punctularia strigosozonata HHB-11173 SS5]|uniref:ankyrin n=1 Tax=Punctularia strigosozonata (strain HHB-11173) TaxID=741275 RepID=UPI0004417B6B|nr:ankyrin [Punctularia strigosozonata HHB-11173 SS5]EIN06434.1 ankyrin [Punctularia strigosozonata HHB-11173 SS5]
MVQLPSEEERDDLLFSCRYGDLEDVQRFVDTFGAGPLAETRDGNENTVLHMVSGNGHADVLDYLLPLIPAALLSAKNSSGSTPLHWAALNAHLAVAKKLVEFKPEGIAEAKGIALGASLIDVKNNAGRTPLGEAENTGWEEGAKWFVEVMSLDLSQTTENPDDAEGDRVGDDVQNVEIEIQDADGARARMSVKTED